MINIDADYLMNAFEEDFTPLGAFGTKSIDRPIRNIIGQIQEDQDLSHARMVKPGGCLEPFVPSVTTGL